MAKNISANRPVLLVLATTGIPPGTMALPLQNGKITFKDHRCKGPRIFRRRSTLNR